MYYTYVHMHIYSESSVMHLCILMYDTHIYTHTCTHTCRRVCACIRQESSSWIVATIFTL